MEQNNLLKRAISDVEATLSNRKSVDYSNNSNANNQTNTPLSSQKVSKKEIVDDANLIQNNYQIKPYDKSSYRDSSFIGEMVKLGKEREEEYKNRGTNAQTKAKIHGWTNLLTSLGKLAGGGYATYVPNNDNILLKSLKDVDDMRENYYRIKNDNAINLLNQRAREQSHEEQKHNAIESANYERAQKLTDDYNKWQMERAKFTAKDKTDTYSNDDIYKQKDLALKQQRNDIARKNADIDRQYRIERLNQIESKNNKDSFITYNDGKNVYDLTRSDAIDILTTVLIKYKESEIAPGLKSYLTEDNLDLMKQAVNGDVNTNENAIRTKALELLKKSPYSFKDVLDRTKRNSNN